MNNEEHLVKGQDNASNFAESNELDTKETPISDKAMDDVCLNSNEEEFTDHTEGQLPAEVEQESEETQDDEESNKIHISPIVWLIIFFVVIRIIFYCFSAYNERKLKESWEELQKNEKFMEDMKNHRY